MSTELYKDYWKLRQSNDTLFGYGLQRRTAELLSVIRHQQLPTARVVDMGCADGAMVAAVRTAFNVQEAIGIDIFEHGVPPGIDGVAFVQHDLYKHYPYPCADGSADLIIVSAFYKHHPQQEKFLEELRRILAPGGAIVFLEPRRWVVRLGALLGYFNPRYCPHPWTPRSLSAQLPKGLSIGAVDNYWLAPTPSLRWIETLTPNWIRQKVGLHQAVIVREGTQSVPDWRASSFAFLPTLTSPSIEVLEVAAPILGI